MTLDWNLATTLAFAAALLGGCTLIVIALRGRREGDHRHCRRCEFDLFGHTLDCRTCPECGSSLSAPRAVVIGERMRRSGMLAFGLVLAIVAAAPLSVRTWTHLTQTDLTPYKPLWLLGIESRRGNQVTRHRAVNEFERRLKLGSLSGATLDAIIDRALAIQIDPKGPWMSPWGDLIETARARARLSDERWRQYVRQSRTAVLRVRARVRRGDPVPIVVESSASRTGSRGPLFGVEEHFRGTEREEVILPAMPPADLTPLGFNYTAFVRFDAQRLQSLPDGPQMVRIVNHVIAREAPTKTGRVIVEFDLPLEAPFEFLPANVDSVTPIDDESLRADRIWVLELGFSPSDPKQLVALIHVVNTARTNLAFEVFARSSSGREWKLQPIVCRRQEEVNVDVSGPVEGLHDDRIDVVLRSSADVARNTLDIFDYWNGEVVLRDIPITPPATRPTTKPRQ